MLLLVPEPVWNTSTGNCASCRPSATSSAARWMANAAHLVEVAELEVGAGRRPLHQAERADEPARHRQAADREVLHRALRLRAPQRARRARAARPCCRARRETRLRPCGCAPRGCAGAADGACGIIWNRNTSRMPRMSLTPLTALSPVDGRYAARCTELREHLQRVGPDPRPRPRRDRLAAGARRPSRASPRCRASPPADLAAAAQPSPPSSPRPTPRRSRRSSARPTTTSRPSSTSSSRSSARTPAWQLAPRVRALRLHVRGHQQPRPTRCMCREARARGAAAAARRAARRAARDGARARRRRDDVAHARPARDADDARQGSRRVRAPAAPGARRVRAPCRSAAR